jgi:hypothetical protein
LDHVVEEALEVIEPWFGLAVGFLSCFQVPDTVGPPHFGCGERHHRGVKVRAQRGPHAREYQIGHGVDLGRIWLGGEAVAPRVL